MTNDLVVATIGLTLLSAALFVAGWRVGNRTGRVAFYAVSVAAVAALTVYAVRLHDSVLLTRLMPVAVLPAIGRVMFPMAAFVAGLTAARIRAPWWRRILAPLPLILVAGHFTFDRFLDPPPQCDAPSWVEGVCMQTHPATCGPAGAATLLREHGIEGSERELAALCLTRSDGTTMHGLYRGLLVKTRGTPWRPEAFAGSLDVLRRRLRRGPVIVTVMLRNEDAEAPDFDPRYTTDWGWQPGMAHSVVITRALDDTHIEVADPATGRERWNLDALRVLWKGRGIQLTPRVGP